MLNATTQSSIERETEEWGGHPLFPRAATETGPDRRKFDRILLIRYHANGSREVASKTWKGSELHSWQQILDEYGGECTYQLAAQCGKTHRFSAWSEKCYFSGPAQKPFGKIPVGEVVRQDAPIQQPLQTQPPMIDVLLQMNLAIVKMLLDQQAAQQPNPIELLRALAPLINQGPTQFEILKEMLPLMNREEDTSQALMQGMEFARELHGNAPIAEPARANDDIGDMMNIVKLIAEVRPANPAPAPPTPPPTQLQSALPPPCPPPPGYGWLYTQRGWVAFPIAMTAQSPVANANRAVSSPIPQAPKPAAVAPPMKIHDEDVLLRKLAEHPETRAKIRAMLATPQPAHERPHGPVPAPPVAQPASTAPTPEHTPPAPLQTGVTMPDAKPPAPVPAAMVSPGKPPRDGASTIPVGMQLNDKLRAMLAEAEFQKLALSLAPKETQHIFDKLVQTNTRQLCGVAVT